MNEHERWMRIALDEAQMAADEQEVPVGAVLVRGGSLLARAHNVCRQQGDPTAHAELLCLRQALAATNGRLEDCTLYVTMEPCAMCAGACVNAKLPKLVFGAFDAQAGCCGSVLDLCDHALLWSVEVWGGVLESECASLLTAFFRERRGAAILQDSE
jgi:tRNA(Arg) A34 adenosine deaminase TadA